MTLDKRYKILSCLDFGSPLSVEELYSNRMRSRGKFFLSVVGTLASVFAAVFGLISIFIALS